ncbi:MAG: hypothetical protein U1E76_27595 [Planctomycetota bacterium]
MSVRRMSLLFLLVVLLGSLVALASPRQVMPPGEDVRCVGMRCDQALQPSAVIPRHPLFVTRKAAARLAPEQSSAATSNGWDDDLAEHEEEDFTEMLDMWDRKLPADEYRAAIECARVLPGGGGSPGAYPPGSAQWTEVGAGIYDPVTSAHRAGRVRCAAYAYDVAQGMTTLFLGATGGGLWKYHWGLGRWQTVSSSLSGSPSVGAFVVDANDARRMLIGTGDLNRYGGTGIYYTTNAGQQWSRATMSPTPNAIMRIRADRSNAQVFLASTDAGIFRSQNLGVSWTRVSTATTTDLAQDPSYPQYWWAGAPGIGVLESSDWGQTFHAINGNGGTGIPDPVGRVSITVCDAASNYVYALISNGNGGINGVYRSRDYGRNWTLIDNQDIAWGQAEHAAAIAVDPRDPKILIVANAGFQRTTNATSTPVVWVRAKQPGHADYTSITFIPSPWAPSNTWALLTNDGGYCTYDYATEAFFTDGNLRGLNIAQVFWEPHGLASSRLDASLLLSGTQDNGVVKLDTDAARPVEYLWGGDGGQVSISSNNTGDFFASIGGPPFGRNIRVRSGGADGVDCSMQPNGYPPTILHDPAYTSPLVFTLDMQSFLFYAYEPNIACNWRAVNSMPLPTTIKVFDVANDPFDLVFYVNDWAGTVYVMDTSVHGRLGNMTFSNRTPVLPNGSTRTDGYAIADRFVSQPNTVYYTTAISTPARTLMSTDRGVHWTDCTGNLANGAYGYFWELVSLPTNQNVLLLATSVGLYRSDNRGASWYRFMDGLPQVVDVRQIELSASGSDMIARIATNGRGFWERIIR